MNDPSSSPETALSIIIPAYLEAESLRTLIPQIHAAAAATTSAHELLIIDTEQPLDDTAEVCAASNATHIRRTGGNSYGDALRAGIAHARGRYILCMDADGSHNPASIATLWAQRNHADIVIGSRYAPGGHTENPALLIFLSYLVNLTFRLVFRLRARDVTNSFRLYRAEILKPLHLQSNDFDILEEVLIKAVSDRPPATIVEVPITFERRKTGESKRDLVRFAFGYLATLRKLRRFQREARRHSQTQLAASHTKTP